MDKVGLLLISILLYIIAVGLSVDAGFVGIMSDQFISLVVYAAIASLLGMIFGKFADSKPNPKRKRKRATKV